ncbi:UNVERIFIED_CONTAM: Nucleolar protein 4 [Gekko kuhli]
MESGDRDMYRQFQDWCLRTYGDSGKTKTVTRKKYERIVQLLNGSETSSTDNAKFKFWVKSKGFQLGSPDEVSGGGAAGGGGGKQVLYVPVKTTPASLGSRDMPGWLQKEEGRVINKRAIGLHMTKWRNCAPSLSL